MTVSVEVLDCAYGYGAEGARISLFREIDSGWQRQAECHTGAAGVVAALGPTSQRGRYRLVVDVDEYYQTLGTEPAVSQVELVFRIFRPGEVVRVQVSITPTSCFALRRNGRE